MPLVLAQRDPNYIKDRLWGRICQALPMQVAAMLSMPDEPDGALTDVDIEIRPSDMSKFAVNNKPLEIVILAQDFPGRRKKSDEAAKVIGETLRGSFPSKLRQYMGDKAFVWIFLGQTGFYMVR